MSDAIRFVLDGQTVTVADVAPTMTLLDYLREQAGRRGTKEGCAEGDCGACTVVLGELSPDGSAVDYRAVNSCIRFLPTIDGRELVTVESLRDGDTLHPVQQAIVDAHGSQCGFCTPGFVMSLLALYLATPDAAPTRERVIAALAGNLCRCTGYRPLIDAGCRMHQYPTPARWSAADADRAERVQALLALRRDQGLSLPGFQAPRTLKQLREALAAQPQALLLAGGTDIGLWVTKLLRDLPPMVYLGDVAELRTIDTDADGCLRIGAAVSHTDAWAAIVARYPMLDELAQRFASPPVRNAGTLCGNLANGSPIGDAMPALIALGATIELHHHSGTTRCLPLDAFYLGYQQKDLAPGEFVAAVYVPAPQPAQRIASYKLSKRIEQDISAVCVGINLTLDADAVIVDARIAFGGMAATPQRAIATEAQLIGQTLSVASFDAAAAALATDFQPLSDLRASSAYRLRAAGNLLRRFALEQTQAATPLRTHALDAGSLDAPA